MGKRHEAIGIKQAIRFEWMQKAANLLLAGLDAKTIRQELHEFLADRKGNGSEGERSDQTRTFVVNNLMKIWVSPDPELIPFRDASLAFLRENPSMALAVHWGMISAVYPFWFNVARQTGRLLALQDQVTQTQIINRLKEQYGDRQTVSRYRTMSTKMSHFFEKKHSLFGRVQHHLPVDLPCSCRPCSPAFRIELPGSL